jgi:hypothetical protein
MTRKLFVVAATAAFSAYVASYTGQAQERGASTGGSSTAAPAIAATPQAGSVTTPESSRDQGPLFAHTNVVVLNAPAGGAIATPSSHGALAAAEGGAGPLVATVQLPESPKSMGCVYVGNPAYPGCVPSFGDTGGPSALGDGVIVIVDAFDNPNAANDLATFDSHFGLLPPPSFTKIYANGDGACSVPPFNANWALEESLDIEWAHVFAPKAAIVLVEACNNSFTELFYAEQVAFNYIVNNYTSTGGQVTNSWQGSEFSGQISDDLLFTDHYYNGSKGWKPAILALASSGDDGFISGQAGYPSANPWVLTAGGTSVLRNSVTHNYYTDACWGGSGGGISALETWSNTFTGGNTGAWAPYQYPIFGQSNRATPDLSFNADPASGVYVYSGSNGGWYIVGGTSVSSPALAGIINRAGNKLGTVFIHAVNNNSFFNTEEQELLYSQIPTKKAYAANFRDITTGSNGQPAKILWDYCTGVGRPKGINNK